MNKLQKQHWGGRKLGNIKYIQHGFGIPLDPSPKNRFQNWDKAGDSDYFTLQKESSTWT